MAVIGGGGAGLGDGGGGDGDVSGHVSGTTVPDASRVATLTEIMLVRMASCTP